MTKRQAETPDRELWRGKGIGIGMYDNGFTVYDIHITPETDKHGNPNKQAGKEVQGNRTYHQRLHQALAHAANRAARSEAKSLGEYVAVFERTARELMEATRGQ